MDNNINKKEAVLKFINQMFLVFGITIVILSLFCLIIGEKAQHVSTLFNMGYMGLSIETIFQMLLASFLITGINTLVYSDLLQLYISKTTRTIVLFTFIFGIIFVFIHLFKWFPTDVLMNWLLFALCFIASSFIAIYITFTTEKADDKNMELALKEFKEKLNDNSNETQDTI